MFLKKLNFCICFMGEKFIIIIQVFPCVDLILLMLWISIVNYASLGEATHSFLFIPICPIKNALTIIGNGNSRREMYMLLLLFICIVFVF